MTRDQLLRYWQKERARAWREAEARHRLPAPIPEGDREEVDRDFEKEVKDAVRSEKTPAVFEEVSAEYREAVASYVRRIASYLASLPAARRRGKTARPQPRSRSPRPTLDYKLRLRRCTLDFVVPRTVSLFRLFEGSLKESGRRIRWKPLAADWNRLHPQDPPIKPQTLEQSYRRALADPRVREPYIEHLRAKWRTWAQAWQETLETFRITSPADQAGFQRQTLKDRAAYIALHERHLHELRNPSKLPLPKSKAARTRKPRPR